MSIACSTCIMLASLFFLLNNVIFSIQERIRCIQHLPCLLSFVGDWTSQESSTYSLVIQYIERIRHIQHLPCLLSFLGDWTSQESSTSCFEELL